MIEQLDFDINVEESYGVICQRLYVVKSAGRGRYKVAETKDYQTITSFVMNLFLPYGYPHSVSQDYLRYQIFDSIQAFASSITGSVCTHSIMKGVGVGDASATALAATFTWLYKDGVSMLGKIAFAWLQGTSLDIDCKKWRLFADILNDVAMLLDLLSPFCPYYFTFIICVSGVMKAIVGVAGGCTRAALTQHQAIKNNMADVSAKDGSQETLVNFIALLCSLFILPIVTESVMLTCFLYFLMTAIHITANYFAVKSVVMNTFNERRFEIYACDYLKKAFKISMVPESVNLDLLSVDEVNSKESVFFDFSQEKVQIKLGASFEDFVCYRSCEEVRKALKLYDDANYLLRIHIKAPSTALIYVTLNKKATAVNIMEAYFQALFIKNIMDSCPFSLAPQAIG
ncbi:hypothetical protein JTE90_023833 [Oedothorax gibbosus]|uniref:Uncharacterized protein n=1 Tax=Oedothorax gibbosus TaxID=931172 RepID=A0AAV6VKS1_9ARAC|nr:hypothetical protein JTE90_023833 [Oedothorax gibbosus]